jgi:2-polyprenyl-6-methoxyphenol hydroxylase-like FAD-dependent oxidoreductase
MDAHGSDALGIGQVSVSLTPSRSTGCCVVGGGPAGIMLGFLLARAGVSVVVLEKHMDFFRDFRGDTIHPATTDILADLGLLDEFLGLPHTEIDQLELGVDGSSYQLVDFRHLPTRCKFMTVMPQWDFLDFLSRRASRYPTFHLEMGCEATDLLRHDGRVTGVRASTPEGDVEIEAPLVVACDGRSSVLRDRAGLPLRTFGVAMDVLWFRIPRGDGDLHSLGSIGGGQFVIAIDRGDYWQCGVVIAKGSLPVLREQGLDTFRHGVTLAAPFLAAALAGLRDWDQVKLLDVRTNRLLRWHRPGLLCIGDAAHAMSPAGAVGVNYAIADAVATANMLAEPLRRGTLRDEHLAAVQRRRDRPTRYMQALQAAATGGLNRDLFRPPTGVLRVVSSLAPARRLIGRTIGLGFRPERVLAPDVWGV